MADPLSLILGGGQLLGGLFSGLIGGGQRRQGKELLQRSPHLAYEIPPEAIQAASEGLPSAQYDQAMKNIQRQQAAAISAANERKSGLSTISKTQALTNDAMGELDAQNAAARMSNQRVLSQYRDKAWSVKDRQRQEDRAYAYGLMGAGGQNIASGIDKGIAGFGGIGYGLFGDGTSMRAGGRRPSGGQTTYYNGYDENSSYGDFNNGYN
jgi:hypothetical protein